MRFVHGNKNDGTNIMEWLLGVNAGRFPPASIEQRRNGPALADTARASASYFLDLCNYRHARPALPSRCLQQQPSMARAGTRSVLCWNLGLETRWHHGSRRSGPAMSAIGISGETGRWKAAAIRTAERRRGIRRGRCVAAAEFGDRARTRRTTPPTMRDLMRIQAVCQSSTYL